MLKFYTSALKNFISYRTLQSVFQEALCITKMEIKANVDIEAMLARLREASNQVRTLKMEIKEISQEIHVLSESEIFRKHLETNPIDFGFSDFSDDENVGPSVKKATCSNNLSLKRSITNSFDNLKVCKKMKKVDFAKNGEYVTVYTDGACENNGKPNAKAGIGIWFGDNHPLNVARPVVGKATNNTAEIQACIQAIQIAIDNGITKLQIMTDSQFTINCMTQWMHRWKKNNWKLAGGGDVKNKHDLKKLDELSKQIDVKWVHVAGHNGIRGNEEADRLARQGATQYRS